MKKISFIFLLLLFMGQSFAQEEDNKMFKISSFNISVGTINASVSHSKTDYLNLKGMVENPELFINPDDYPDAYYDSDFSGAFNTKILIGINPYSKKTGEINPNQELRIGIGMNSGTRQSYSFHNTVKTTIDTFYSVNENPNIYQDKVETDGIFYNVEFKELNFSFSYLFKTSLEKRFRFYAGIGAEYGISIQSYVDVHSYSSVGYEYRYLSNTPYSDSYESHFSTLHIINTNDCQSNQTNFINPVHTIRAIVPVGIGFRFSNNHQLFKHLNVYSEINPGIEYQILPNNFNYVNPYIGIAIFGLRYEI